LQFQAFYARILYLGDYSYRTAPADNAMIDKRTFA